MDVFSMFRNPQQQQQPAAPAVGTGNAQPNMGAPGSGGQVPAVVVDPNSPAPNQQQQQQQEPKSPLAEFAKLWETTPVVEGETPQTDWNDPNSILPNMKIDSKKMFEAAQRIDFAKVMDRTKVEAALKGDAQAFMDVINSVHHSAYASMAMSTTKIVEASLKQMVPKLFEALPNHIRKHVVSDTVNTDNPIFNDPAVAPMLEMVKQQMTMKHPKASAKEIADMAKKYVAGFAETVTASNKSKGGQQQQQRDGQQLRKTGSGNEDWTDYFTPEQSTQQ